MRKYICYQKEYYPSLDLATKEDKNGWWTDFRTQLGYVYINHKIQEGYVDLTFPKAADKTDSANSIAEWMRRHKITNVTVVKTKLSIMFRINVPKLDMSRDFDFIDKDDLNRCFDAIQEFADFANIVELANLIALR